MTSSLAISPASAFSFLARKAITFLPGRSALVTLAVTGTCQVALRATCWPLTNTVTSLSQVTHSSASSMAFLSSGSVNAARKPTVWFSVALSAQTQLAGGFPPGLALAGEAASAGTTATARNSAVSGSSRQGMRTSGMSSSLVG